MIANPADDDRAALRADTADWRSAVPRRRYLIALGGFAALLAFAGGFVGWGVLAPLSGAVIAQGVVQASGQNQIVDHLEGGIVEQIHAKEGDHVEQGQTLITLETVQITTELNRILSALILRRAEHLRAQAERDDKPTLLFPQQLRQQARDQGLEEDLDEQVAEFVNRLARHNSQLDVIARRIDAMSEQISSLRAQEAAETEKRDILVAELADKEKLLERGLTEINEVYALRRARVDSAGQLGAVAATIAERRASIAGLEQERQSLIASRQETAATRINELRGEINDLREQLQARRDTLSRAKIRAPIAGTIVSLSKNTVGSVIGAGEVIAEILPQESESIVEARVNPIDADVIHVGQKARLRLVALNMRVTPELPASVSYMSADRLIDQATGEPFYIARLTADVDTAGDISGTALQPGMPIEVLIATEPRTFASYLIQPLTDSFNRAFREE